MEANIEIAQSLFHQNKFQEVIDACKTILPTDNNSIEALKLIAKSFLAIRNLIDYSFVINYRYVLRAKSEYKEETTKMMYYHQITTNS